MSYYESNYYQNPGPVYVGSDVGEPVPGWGPMPNMAGPKRVGVGEEGAPVQPPTDIASAGPKVIASAATGSEPTPWWAWVLGAAVLGAGVGIARRRGWI